MGHCIEYTGTNHTANCATGQEKAPRVAADKAKPLTSSQLLRVPALKPTSTKYRDGTCQRREPHFLTEPPSSSSPDTHVTFDTPRSLPPIKPQHIQYVFRNRMKRCRINTLTLPQCRFNARYQAAINAGNLLRKGAQHHSHNFAIGMKRSVKERSACRDVAYEFFKVD